MKSDCRNLIQFWNQNNHKLYIKGSKQHINFCKDCYHRKLKILNGPKAFSSIILYSPTGIIPVYKYCAINDQLFAYKKEFWMHKLNLFHSNSKKSRKMTTWKKVSALYTLFNTKLNTVVSCVTHSPLYKWALTQKVKLLFNVSCVQ